MSYTELPVATRIYLTVPFGQKEYAKELGCRWDKEVKKWYCIDGSKFNIERCLHLWGKDAYKLINGKHIKLSDIKSDNRGLTRDIY